MYVVKVIFNCIINIFFIYNIIFIVVGMCIIYFIWEEVFLGFNNGLSFLVGVFFSLYGFGVFKYSF